MKTSTINYSTTSWKSFLLGFLLMTLQTGCNQNLDASPNHPRHTAGPSTTRALDLIPGVDDTENFTPDIHSGSAQYDAFRRQECEDVEFLKNLSSREKGVFCLRKTCQEIPGTRFDEVTSECLCTRGLTFRSENRRGFCLPTVWLDGEFLDQSNSTLTATFRNEIPTQGTTIHNSQLPPFRSTSVSLVLDSSHQAPEMRRIFAELKSAPMDFPTHYLAHSHFVVGRIPFSIDSRYDLAREIYSASEAPLTIHSGYSFLGDGVDLSYYEPKLELAAAALGSPTAIAALTQNQRDDFFHLGRQLPSEIASAREIQILGFAINAWNLRHPLGELSAQEMNSLAGCAEYCVLEQIVPMPQFLGFNVKFEKTYFLGTKVSSRIVVRDSDTQNIKSILLLNPGNGVSAVIHIQRLHPEDNQRSDGSTEHRYASVISVYDRHWAFIGQFSQVMEQNLPLTLNELHSQSLAVAGSRGSNPIAKAAICDTWPHRFSRQIHGPLLLGNQFSNAVPNLVNGELASAQGSLFGWTPASTSLEDYFGESLAPRDWGYLSNPRDLHAVEVSNAFFGAGDNTMGNVGAIAPISLKNGCFAPQRYRSWRSDLLSQDIKVINLSIAEFKSKEICSEAYSAIFNDPEEPFLFVLAAGNESWLGNRLICPQNILASKKNGIIVGSLATGSTTELASYSNFGANSVDILSAVAGTADHQGTSFAAPVVSKVAAEIFAAHPALKASEIRLAILLTAEIPDLQHPLPVRSGGNLHPGNAKRMATVLDAARRGENAQSEFVDEELKNFIRQIYCPQPQGRHRTITSCNAANQRIAILTRNRIFSPQ